MDLDTIIPSVVFDKILDYSEINLMIGTTPSIAPVSEKSVVHYDEQVIHDTDNVEHT